MLEGAAPVPWHLTTREVSPDLCLWKGPHSSAQGQWRGPDRQTQPHLRDPLFTGGTSVGELGMTGQWGQGKRIVLPTSGIGEDPFPNLWNIWFCPALQRPGHGGMALSSKSAPLQLVWWHRARGHFTRSDSGRRPNQSGPAVLRDCSIKQTLFFFFFKSPPV